MATSTIKIDEPKIITIENSSLSFESGYGSGVIGGDGIKLIISNNMIAFTGQINAQNFVYGGVPPRIKTTKPSILPANALYTPVGIARWGQAGGTTLATSAYALRDRFVAQTDSDYLYFRSTHFLGAAAANGWLEFIFFGASFPLRGI